MKEWFNSHASTIGTVELLANEGDAAVMVSPATPQKERSDSRCNAYDTTYNATSNGSRV